MRHFALAVVVLCGVFVRLANGQIPATDDSSTVSSQPTTNFGTQPTLQVIGPGVNSLIRFDLTALPAGLASSNISNATVRLYIDGVTTTGNFDVYLVAGAWSEGTI